ncbi:MAG: biotin--[acetyl-CoA-carboxylase] ligase [Acidimicrobiia bacterium]
MPGDLARRRLIGSRFADVRWVPETGSTNVDAMVLARDGEPEGIVIVADHQRDGRGRGARRWESAPRQALLASVLLRPPAGVAPLCTMALAVAAAAATEDCAGVVPGLKWPNDLVWPGDGSGPDRKLAGILAEADWPARSAMSGGWSPAPAWERMVVVAGIGFNLHTFGLPPEVTEGAVALDELTPAPVDAEALLISLLGHLEARYQALVSSGDPLPLLSEWRARSATIGRRVRVDLGRHDVEGTAVDVTEAGHLVVRTLEGALRTLAVGDVIHLRY